MARQPLHDTVVDPAPEHEHTHDMGSERDAVRVNLIDTLFVGPNRSSFSLFQCAANDRVAGQIVALRVGR